MNRLARRIVEQWHRPTLAGQFLLRPLAFCFGVLAALRRAGYRRARRRVQRLPVPVIVVGNLTVGGSGKTPLVAHLVAELARAGWSPGIVSRGYGRRSRSVIRVEPGGEASASGDEPLLLAEQSARPVAVGSDRPAAAALLLDDCDVIVSDDGLQHYALGRDLEIAVIDGEVGLGNGRLLPAGPLREPARRLDEVDFVAVRNGAWPGAWRYAIRPAVARHLVTGESRALEAFAGQAVHAVAGIGRPGRFFNDLEAVGLEPARHAFPDHHAFVVDDLAFGDAQPVLMTAKDAVKCRAFADRRMWQVDTAVVDHDGLAQAVCERLAGPGRPDGP